MPLPFNVTPGLSPDAAAELSERGFVVLAGPVAARDMAGLQAAYDDALTNAAAADVRVGSTSTRVTDLVNRGSAFDALYTWPPALDACSRVIGQPFRLSAMLARTVHPGAPAQELHVDVPRHADAWPMLGLIFMVDPFQVDNGVTRFVPGSHRWAVAPRDRIADLRAPHPGEVLACGPAGSVILFDASTWHGHVANRTSVPRRSLQATYIPRAATPATDFGARMRPETYARLGPVGRYLTGVDDAAPPS